MVDKEPEREVLEPSRPLSRSEMAEFFSNIHVPDGALDDHLEHAHVDVQDVVTEEGTPDDVLPFEDRRPIEPPSSSEQP